MAELPRLTYPVGTIAGFLLITEQRIHQLQQAGVIPRAARGRYDLAEAVHGYIKFIKGGAELPGEADHKLRLTKAKADLASMEAERIAGGMIPAHEVERAWSAIAGRFRSRVLAIAAKAAPLVAVEVEADRCHEIIQAAVYEALAELSSGGAGADGGDLPLNGTAAEAHGESMGGQVSETFAGG